jgi:hypothetical protein
MSTGTELVVAEPRERTPAQYIAQVTDVAAACKSIVATSVQLIQGKKYLKVEAWQAIAIAHGCVASSRGVERVETGYSAIGEVRRVDTGAVIATAEGFVGDDERMWASRPEFARRAMAQTRAISRACRSAFAHVVVAMNAGLETTPAEEMDGVGHIHANGHSAPAAAERKPPRQVKPAATDKPFAGVVIRITSKSSETNGKAWTRYGILLGLDDGSEQWCNTFDGGLADVASEAASRDLPVKGTLRPGKPRPDGSVSYDLVSLDAAIAPSLEVEVVDTEATGEELPF